MGCPPLRFHIYLAVFMNDYFFTAKCDIYHIVICAFSRFSVRMEVQYEQIQKNLSNWHIVVSRLCDKYFRCLHWKQPILDYHAGLCIRQCVCFASAKW